VVLTSCLTKENSGFNQQKMVVLSNAKGGFNQQQWGLANTHDKFTNKDSGLPHNTGDVNNKSGG
jgi:hypothetical protein